MCGPIFSSLVKEATRSDHEEQLMIYLIHIYLKYLYDAYPIFNHPEAKSYSVNNLWLCNTAWAEQRWELKED